MNATEERIRTAAELMEEYEAAHRASVEARAAWRKAQDKANGLIRAAREAHAQETYGLPYKMGKRGEYTLFMVAPDGSAVYRSSSVGGGKNYYIVREPDGTETNWTRSQARLPKRGWKKVETL